MSISLKNIQSSEKNYYDDSDESEPEYIDEPIEMPEYVPRYTESESSDDVVDEQALMRSRLITRIYINEFPEKLKTYRKLLNKIDEMSIDELQNLRREFEIAIGMKTSINGMTNTMLSGISMLESTLTMLTPLDPSGLTQLCSQDKEFKDDLKLISLKYAEKMNTRPEIRVGLTLAKNIMLLDKVNKARAAAEHMATIHTNESDNNEQMPPPDNTDNMPIQINDINDLFADI